jgi:hypothetical protein
MDCNVQLYKYKNTRRSPRNASHEVEKHIGRTYSKGKLTFKALNTNAYGVDYRDDLYTFSND